MSVKPKGASANTGRLFGSSAAKVAVRFETAALATLYELVVGGPDFAVGDVMFRIPSSVRSQHPPHDDLRPVERPTKVDLHHPPPGGGISVRERRHIDLSGVVDEQPRHTEFRFDPPCLFFNGRSIRDIRNACGGATAELTDEPGGLLERISGSTGEGDARAASGELERELVTQSPPAARHHGDDPAEVRMIDGEVEADDVFPRFARRAASHLARRTLLSV